MSRVHQHPQAQRTSTPKKNYGMQDQARATGLCYKVTKMCTKFSTLRNEQGQILVQFSSNESSKGRKISMCMRLYGVIEETIL